MAMTFSDDQKQINADGSTHNAYLFTSISWRVTWLGQDQRLTRTQAITAMTLAEFIQTHEAVRSWLAVDATVSAIPRPLQTDQHAADLLGRKAWILVKTWAGELGLNGISAINMIISERKWEPAP